MEKNEGQPVKQFLCKSLNGVDVYIDYGHTNIEVHTVENPDLLGLVKEVLKDSNLEGDNIAISKDMGRQIGKTNCVITDGSDEIVFAKRIGRESYSRFVKNRELEPTTNIAIVLHKTDDGYNLWSAWCGDLVPVEADDNGRMRTIEGFWDTHALVYDTKIIQPGTETFQKPSN